MTNTYETTAILQRNKETGEEFLFMLGGTVEQVEILNKQNDGEHAFNRYSTPIIEPTKWEYVLDKVLTWS